MNNKDTFDILHSEFDDCPQIPDSLSKRNIVAKLKEISPEKKSTVSFKKLSALAAAMILVMVCAVVATTDFREDLAIEIDDIVATAPAAQSAVAPTLNNQIVPEGETALLRANSREEIVEMFLNNYKENNNRFNYLTGYGADMDDYKGVADAMTSAPESNGAVNETYNDAASESTADHAQTNTQTKGVDEGDIIKTDSKYIYFVGSDGSGNKKLKIIDTLTMTAVYNSYLYDKNGDIMWISDMYLKDDILVAVCAQKNNDDYYRSVAYGYYGSAGSTVIVSYDITDRANPKLIRRETQDGAYRSSRLIGNNLYTVSQYYVRAESEEAIESVCIPKVAGQEIACDCIYMPENMGESYICLSALDISDKDGRISAVAVLGSTENYYCSEDTLYIIADKRNYDAGLKLGYDGNTVINSFSLDGLNISYKATGEVKGSTARSQYSLDEYENNLRVATTYYNYNTQKNESSLYVLDENLDIIGKLEDIANNEQIKSVRYMGEKAYVVTFRNTDPLFAIDLSDPKNPKVLGELKLPGYSAYLHPIGENLLLGIGYDGDANNADFNSVKVSLFDISDPVNLKELDNIVLNDKNISTPVNNNPKALIYKADEGIIGFPIESYDYNISERIEYGYYLIKVQGSELKTMRKLIHEDRGYVNIYSFRGTYIGDKFFTVSDYMVKKFDFATGKEIAKWSNSEGVNIVATTSAEENKGINDSPKTTVTATTQVSTSQGYTVDESDTTVKSSVTGQTTPAYNPNNPKEIIEMPTE